MGKMPTGKTNGKNALFERFEKRTLYYEYIMSMTSIVLAFSVFVGLLVSIFPLVEGKSFGIMNEFFIIVPFVSVLGFMLYIADRKLRK